MPMDRKAQLPKSGQQGSREIYPMLILVVLTLATIIISLFLSANSVHRPDASRIAQRINHNITSAHLWTHDYFLGSGSQTIEEILFVYERAAEFVKISLDGGDIDGVPIEALKNPLLRSQMEEIGQVIDKLRMLTVDLLAKEKGSGEFKKVDIVFEAGFSEMKILTNRLIASSQNVFQRKKRNFQLVQIILMTLALGLFLVILFNSRRAHKEKYRALSLVGQIEERRKLALEGANLGTWDWDVLTGKVIFNDRILQMLGLEVGDVEPNYKTWESLIHPEDLPQVLEKIKVGLSGESSRLYSEYRLWSQPGHWIWVMDLGKVLERDEQGNPLRAVGTRLDITQQKTVEMALRAEKERAQKYLDLAGVMFIALDTKGVVTMINRKGCQIVGLPEDYIVGRNWMENFVPERIRADIQQVAHELMSDESNEHEQVVNPILTASGSEVLIAWQNTTLLDEQGKVIGYLSSGTDITRQTRHERALEKYRRRLQSLAAQLAITEDRLRQDIASGLHDSIGQNLAALKLSLDLIGLNLDHSDIPTVREDIAKASSNIDHIVRETWSLSFHLSPPGLYESGIASALEWLVGKFNEKYQCHFVLTTHEHPLPREKDGRGLLFQMIRELMINAVKNGEATEVEISLSGAGSFILASVTDNGTGFDSVAALAEAGDAGGFGLFSIRERLAYISGELEIESVVGEGTRVVIRFPLGKTGDLEMEIADEDQNFVG